MTYFLPDTSVFNVLRAVARAVSKSFNIVTWVLLSLMITESKLSGTGFCDCTADAKYFKLKSKMYYILVRIIPEFPTLMRSRITVILKLVLFSDILLVFYVQ